MQDFLPQIDYNAWILPALLLLPLAGALLLLLMGALSRDDGTLDAAPSARWIALMVLLLSSVIMPLAVLGSWTSIRTKVRSYYALMLVLTTWMLGVFVSRDMLLFYVMWELMLVPMYFIIGIWGCERRIY